ncbi:MAG: ATP-binding cassette domain-containing protein [Firmicutes bacterium]|nr:ATP-binding cassette domain-containing protein [Bacillota bacterium]
MLKITELTKTYYVTRSEIQDVLKGLTTEFFPGEFVAVLGESGCGKSTLLNILAGLDSDYGGIIEYKGEITREYSEEQLDDYRKKEVGIVFQSFNLIGHMTALENVCIALAMSDVPDAEKHMRARKLLERVGMSEHQSKRPNQLSGGQKQRAAIARALANDPEVLFADEPTGNLDKESAEEVISLLKEIAASGKTVICVTHSERVAENCTRIITIDDGVIVSDKTAQILQKPSDTESTAAAVKPRAIKNKELFKIAYRNIKQSSQRVKLVIAALSVGIAAFVLMFALSRGIHGYVIENMYSSSSRLRIDITVDAYAAGAFTDANIETIKNLSGVDRVIASSQVSMLAEYKSADMAEHRVLFLLQSLFEGFNATLADGEEPKNENEILISQVMAQKLFGDVYKWAEIAAADKEIEIKVEKAGSFIICGVIKDGSLYDCAYIMENALASLYASGTAPVNKLYVFAKDTDSAAALYGDLSFIYHAERVDKKFDELLSYVDVGTVVLASVSAVSLLVSAIMIFIVTYIGIIERAKEIGILRAIGARKKDIKRIFVFESAMTGFLAGLIGSLMALIIAVAVDLIMRTVFISFNPLIYIMGIIIGTAVSVLSALGPSASSADTDPVEALSQH